MSEAATNQQCAFCFPREQGKHGEIKRQWSDDWRMFIPVCRAHAIALDKASEAAQAIQQAERGQS